MKENVFESFNVWVKKQEMPAGRRKTLIAAAELFAKQGYDRTTTAQISKAAGVSEGTIFKYFKSKDGLKQAMIAPIITNLFPGYGDEFIEKIKSDHDELESFVRFLVTDRFQFLKANKEIVLIVIHDILLDKENFDMIYARMHDRFEQVLQHFGQMLKNDGRVREGVTLEGLMRLLSGQLILYFLQRFHFGVSATDEDKDLEEISNYLLHGILE